MRQVSVSEAYENGFTIAELSVLLQKRFEELYENPDPRETIRRIALTQDAWSFERTRYWLRGQLLIAKPWRRYNPDLEAILDTVLVKFYTGDTMPEFTSAAQARQQTEQSEARKVLMQEVISEIIAELCGMSYAALPDFLLEVIVPKYKESWSEEDFAHIILGAVKLHAQTPEFQASIPKVDVQSMLIKFAGNPELASTSDYLVNLAKSTLPIPDVTPEIQEENMVDYPWGDHISSFETKTLRIGLVKRVQGQMLLEIGLKESPTCRRIVVENSKLVGKGDVEAVNALTRSAENTELLLKALPIYLK